MTEKIIKSDILAEPPRSCERCAIRDILLNNIVERHGKLCEENEKLQKKVLELASKLNHTLERERDEKPRRFGDDGISQQTKKEISVLCDSVNALRSRVEVLEGVKFQVEAQIRRQATMLGSMIDQLRARGIPVDVASVQVIKEKNNFPEEDETDYWPCHPK